MDIVDDLNLISYLEYKKNRSRRFHIKNTYYSKYYKRSVKRLQQCDTKKEIQRIRENGFPKYNTKYRTKRINKSFRINDRFPIMENIEEYDDILIRNFPKKCR